MPRTARILLSLAGACLAGAPLTFAAVPVVQRVQPLAARPGATTRFHLQGDNLARGLDIWTSFPAETRLGDTNAGPEFDLELGAQPAAGLGAFRWISTNGASSLHLFLIDPLPAFVSSGTNRSAATAQALTAPGAVDGSCQELHSDFYRVYGKKGQRLWLEVVAQRLGSPLDPHLRVLDPEQRELMAIDDTAGLGADCRLEFRCPRTADYLVEVRDTRYGGGPNHRYRLRVGVPLPVPLPFLAATNLLRLTRHGLETDPVREHEPNDGPARVQTLAWPARVKGNFERAGDRDIYELKVGRGDRIVVSGLSRSLGSLGDLFLEWQTTNGTRIAEGNATTADDGQLTNRFENAGTYRLVVEELNHRGGPDFFYELQVERSVPGFSLSTAVESVAMPPGGSFEIEVQAQRRDYDGPIRLQLQGLDERFGITNDLIAAKTNATRIRLTTPADIALGEAFDFSIIGQAESATNAPPETRIHTTEALRVVFPALRYPPRELDGFITLCTAGSASATAGPTGRKKKK